MNRSNLQLFDDGSQMTSVPYRKELDGLRAIAVLSVVFCHAGYTAFSGGFIGVDVFFVISGYLITSIIHRELRLKTFSLKRFYERRAKRILPALFFVISISFPLAWLWLWPKDFRDFSESITFVSLFGANIHFYREIGYFDPDVELRPMLHTWSLGVEEQYYLLFPLLLIFLYRFKKQGIVFCVAGLAVTSLLVSQLWLSRNPPAVFYLLPFRAWELLLGALYALFSAEAGGLENYFGTKMRNVIGASGLAAIIAAVFLFSEKTPFPGIWAMIPTLGALLIIAAAQPDTWLGKILSTRPLEAIGLWSYSIYLWHQPVFAFTRYQIELPTAKTMTLMITLVLALSYITWRWIEMPLRHRPWTTRGIFLFSFFSIFFFALIGVLGKDKKDYLKRFAPHYLAELSVEKKLDRNYGLDRHCSDPDAGKNCQTANNPDTLVWGDSYAMHIVPGILASNPDIRLIQRTKSGCGPLLGIAPIFNNNLQGAEDCLRFNKEVMERLARWSDITHIVLSSRLTQYLGEKVQVLSDTGQILPASPKLLAQELKKTMERIATKNRRVVIFSPPPATGLDIGKCLAHSVRFNLPLERCDFQTKDIEPLRQQVFSILESLPKSYPVIWVGNGICDLTMCRSSYEDIFIFRDDGHLSIEGSHWLGKKLDFNATINGQ